MRGQAISNAFFWAIDRSHDATFFHDWFTQGRPGRRRRVSLRRGGAVLRQRPLLPLQPATRRPSSTTTAQTQTLAATESYEIIGTPEPRARRATSAPARASITSPTSSRSSSITRTCTRRRATARLIEAGLTAAFGTADAPACCTSAASCSRSERTSQVYGSTPRVTASLAPQRLFNAPIYASANARVRVPARTARSATASSSATTALAAATSRRPCACRSRA